MSKISGKWPRVPALALILLLGAASAVTLAVMKTQTHSLRNIFTPAQYNYTLSYSSGDAGTNAEGMPDSVTETAYVNTHEFTLSDSIPTWTGHVFLSWQSGGTQYFPGNTISMEMPLLQSSMEKTMTAQWMEGYFRLNYEENGQAVTNMPDDVTVSDASQAAAQSYDFTLSTTIPAREGYVFLGWSRNPGSTQDNLGFPYADSAFTPSTVRATNTERTVTLYAIWGREYTLIYDENGGAAGTAPSDVTVYATGDRYTFTISDTTPTRAGYEFQYWSLTAARTNNELTYAPGHTITVTAEDPSVTLYARYRTTSGYHIYFNGNAKTLSTVSGMPNDQYVNTTDYTATLNIPTGRPTATNWYFQGWAATADAQAADPAYAPGTSITMNSDTANTVTLYAVWARTEGRIIFDLSDIGSGSPASSSKSYYFDLTGDKTVAANSTSAPWYDNVNTEQRPSTHKRNDGLFPNDASGAYVSDLRGWSNTANAAAPEYQYAGFTSLSGPDIVIPTDNDHYNGEGNYYFRYLYPVWGQRYILAFRNSDGSVIDTLNDNNGGYSTWVYPVKNSESHTFTSLPYIQARREFLGWNTQPDQTAAQYAPGASIELSSDDPHKILYPVWGATRYEYRLKIDLNAADVNSSFFNSSYNPSSYKGYSTGTSYIFGPGGFSTWLTSSTTTRNDYKLAGWSLTPEGDAQYIIDGSLRDMERLSTTITVSQDDTYDAEGDYWYKTLYAVWTFFPHYSLDFLTHNGQSSSYRLNGIDYDGPWHIVSGDTNEGSFTATVPSGTGTHDYAKTNIIGYSDTIYGQPGYEIDHTIGSTITISYADNPTYASRQKKYYAVYGFQLDYDLNGGSGTAPASQTAMVTTPNQTCTHDFTVADGSGYTKGYYVFGGWSTSTTSSPAYGSGGGQSGTITLSYPTTYCTTKLYAIWYHQLHLTYDANGGQGGPGYSNATSADASNTFTIEAGIPTREGYTFAGWSDTAGGSSQYQAGDSLRMTDTTDDGKDGREDKTIYAVWQANPYTVSFNANCGEAEGAPADPASINVTYGSAYGTLPVLTRAGFTFGGWFTESDGGTQVTADTIVSRAQNHTLYAHWTANLNNLNRSMQQDQVDTCTVSFDANCGEAEGAPADPDSISVTYGSAYGDLPDMTRDGFIFDGWFTEREGGDQITSDSIVNTAQDHTLYAHWTAAD